MTCTDTVEFIEFNFYSTATDGEAFLRLVLTAARMLNSSFEEENEFVKKEIETRAAHLN